MICSFSPSDGKERSMMIVNGNILNNNNNNALHDFRKLHDNLFHARFSTFFDVDFQRIPIICHLGDTRARPTFGKKLCRIRVALPRGSQGLTCGHDLLVSFSTDEAASCHTPGHSSRAGLVAARIIFSLSSRCKMASNTLENDNASKGGITTVRCADGHAAATNLHSECSHA